MKVMTLVLVTGLWISQAHGAEPFAGEIEDGSWVKFSVTVEGDMDQMLEATIKAVGRTQEAGVDCQWIEVGSTDTGSGQRQEVFKLLFRQRDLNRGSVGLGDVVRAWILPRDSDQPIQANSEQLASLAILFPGDLENEQRPDGTEVVDLAGESLECEILEGESRTEFGDQTVTISHRLLLHDDVPFGLAGFRKEVDLPGQSLTATAQLLEIGGDAESLLQDSR